MEEKEANRKPSLILPLHLEMCKAGPDVLGGGSVAPGPDDSRNLSSPGPGGPGGSGAPGTDGPGSSGAPG